MGGGQTEGREGTALDKRRVNKRRRGEGKEELGPGGLQGWQHPIPPESYTSFGAVEPDTGLLGSDLRRPTRTNRVLCSPLLRTL